MADTDALEQEFKQAHAAQLQALDKKVKALIELRGAEALGILDQAVAEMRYAFACGVWETAYRKECCALRRCNEAIRQEISRQDCPLDLSLGQHHLLSGGIY